MADGPQIVDDVPPVDWRLMRRRALFLLAGSLVVSSAFVCVLAVTNGSWIHRHGGVVGRLLLIAIFFTALSLPVVVMVLAVFNATPRLTWVRSMGGVVIANGVLLPFGYFFVAVVAFDYLWGALWLIGLVLGSVAIHPLALLLEQARASRTTP